MSAPTYEYKTVAMPQTVQGKRKRGISEADLVAGTFGEVIHLEAVEGWEYMRADILAAGTRGGMFSKEPTVTYYSVLVFRRTMESAWPMHEAQSRSEAEARARPRAQPRPDPAPASARRAPSSPVIDASPPAPSAPVRPKPAPVAQREPLAAPAQAAAPTPSRASPESGFGDPTSPLSRGMTLTTGGHFRTEGGSLSEAPERPSPSTSGASPLPPLGSAQD